MDSNPIKYELQLDFFNFEFEVPKTPQESFRDEFWFRFAHPVYNLYIPPSAYPKTRVRAASADKQAKWQGVGKKPLVRFVGESLESTTKK